MVGYFQRDSTIHPIDQIAAEKVVEHNPKVAKWINRHVEKNETPFALMGNKAEVKKQEDLYQKTITFEKDHWCIKYTSNTNISPYAMQISVNPNTGNIEAIQEDERIIVLFKDKVKKEAFQEANGDILNTVDIIPAVTVQVPIEKINEIQTDPSVSAIEKDSLIKVQDQIVDWGNHNIRTPNAWQSNFTGKGIKVAVIDSGVSADHKDLHITSGVSFVHYTDSYDDDNGHGTHVAGIIGAKNNNIGIVGAAPDASIYAVKVLNQDGVGYLSDIIAGIDWAVQNKMDIINLSIGSDKPSNLLKSVVDKAYSNGILIVASAGNTGYGSTGNTIHYPAAYDSVIAVGATSQSNKWATFSSVGPTIEVTAPGVDILSTYLNNSTKKSSGTSMSAPFVSGILALFKEQYPELGASGLRNIIQKNVIDLGDPGRDSYYGFGLIQYSERLKTIERLSGKNRFQVAVNISKAGWPESSNTVLLTNYHTFADALASSPLAFKENAPILLTHKDFLTNDTKEEIIRLKPEKVIVIGGIGSISEDVINTLHSYGIKTIERIGGKDRFEVAYNIAKKMGTTDTAIIANGFNFSDALAIAPFAARNGYIILLATKNNIPNSIQMALKEKNINHTIVVGGEASIDNNVYNMLPQRRRINGKDRFEVAKNIITELNQSTAIMYVATGFSFADAMTGSVLAAKENGAILLSSPTKLPQPIQEIVKTKDTKQYKILGGPKSISEDVYIELMFNH